MAGSPGSGKTLLARALPGILPEMSIEETSDVTRIYSLGSGTPRVQHYYAPWRFKGHKKEQTLIISILLWQRWEIQFETKLARTLVEIPQK